jgi:hypothetical protein
MMEIVIIRRMKDKRKERRGSKRYRRSYIRRNRNYNLKKPNKIKMIIQEML